MGTKFWFVKILIRGSVVTLYYKGVHPLMPVEYAFLQQTAGTMWARAAGELVPPQLNSAEVNWYAEVPGDVAEARIAAGLLPAEVPGAVWA